MVATTDVESLIVLPSGLQSAGRASTPSGSSGEETFGTVGDYLTAQQTSPTNRDATTTGTRYKPTVAPALSSPTVEQSQPDTLCVAEPPSVGLMASHRHAALLSSADVCLTGCVAELVHRVHAVAGPGGHADPVLRLEGLSPDQAHVIRTGRGDMEAEAVGNQAHDSAPALPVPLHRQQSSRCRSPEEASAEFSAATRTRRRLTYFQPRPEQETHRAVMQRGLPEALSRLDRSQVPSVIDWSLFVSSLSRPRSSLSLTWAHMAPQPEARIMTDQPILLKTLLTQRHWQTYSTFCKEYDKAAKKVDPSLQGGWRAGSIEMEGRHHGLRSDHCRA